MNAGRQLHPLHQAFPIALGVRAVVLGPPPGPHKAWPTHLSPPLPPNPTLFPLLHRVGGRVGAQTSRGTVFPSGKEGTASACLRLFTETWAWLGALHTEGA